MILQNSSMIKDRTKDINAAIKAVRNSVWNERAKEIAERLVDKIPLVYTHEKLACVAQRWKEEFNSPWTHFISLELIE